MKYTIMGFLQTKLKEMGLDTIDALILRYFVDFGESKAMKVLVNDNKIYYWVQYEAVIKELPILNMKKCTIQSRFFKLRDAKVLTHYTKKEGGTFSFFGMGERYAELIGEVISQQCCVDKDISLDNPAEDQGRNEGKTLKEEEFLGEVVSNEASQVNSDGQPIHGSEEKSIDSHTYPMDKSTQGYQSKVIPNNPSTKDPSFINPPTPFKKDGDMELEELVSKVIEYLNSSTGKSFKANTKATVRQINGRRNEGFNLQDFKTVIDNMVFLWKGTRFQQYLAPSTLFGSKFETYLQCGRVQHKEEMDNYKRCKGKEPFITKRGNLSSSSEVVDESHDLGAANSAKNLDTQEEVNFILKEDM